MGVAIIAVVIAVVLVVLIRVLAGMDIPIVSTILRAWWNISFKIAAYIPFCGWMAHFIITKGDAAAQAEKELYVKIGKDADQVASDYLQQQAQKAREEEQARQERLKEEAARKELQEDLRRRAGTRDVHLNSDGSRVRVGDGEYMTVEEFKKSL